MSVMSRPATSVPRPKIMSRALALVFLSTFGAMSGFYLLLSVLPLYATSIGAGKMAAGSVTATLMFSTVAAELATPRLVDRFGHRPVLVTGMTLLGAPLLLLPGSRNLGVILAVCAVRGLGFAITVVVTGTLVAALVPAERRGEGLGLYGLVVGVPSVIALPAGVWLSGQTGYTPVFVTGAVLTLAGAAAALGTASRTASPTPAPPARRTPEEPGAAVPDLPARRTPEGGVMPDLSVRPTWERPGAVEPDLSARPAPEGAPVPHGACAVSAAEAAAEPAVSADEHFGVLAALRTGALVRPAAVFSVTAMAAGAIVTFLPVAMVHASGSLAAAALLVMSVSATLSRWWAGRHGDRHGSAGLLVPGAAVAAAGVLGLVLVGSTVVVLAGALVFGAGYGVAQNTSLASMLEKVSASGYGTVSAVWNLSFDAGLGVGAAGFGVLAERTGYPVAFALTGALMFGVIAWNAARKIARSDQNP